MNSGPAGGPGQPPAGLHPPPPSSVSSSRDQHTNDKNYFLQQGNSDPSGLITIMNITVPPVVPVPSGLRFVHPYMPPPPPHPHPPTAQAVSVAQVVSSNSASPVSASSGPSSIVQQQVASRQHPPSVPSPASGVTGATAAYSRDPYRNSSPNVNDRVAIGVSSSPASSQVIGVGNEYMSRGDRPRMLLTSPVSIPPSASPTAPSDYHASAVRNASRCGTGGPTILSMQPQEYRPSPVDMAQLQQDSPPFKKIRLVQPPPQITSSQQQQQQSIAQSECQRITGIQETVKPKPVQLQPLRIDTRPSAGAYTPQTEAISPTLPEPNTQEDLALKTTKDDLLSQLGKLDNEITTRESRCSILRKKLKELEDSQSEVGRQPAEETSQPKHQSIIQKIYADNRKKAEEAHRLLEKLGPIVKLPLYNQPSDTSVYHENRARHQCLKAHLVKRLRREHSERAARHNHQSQTYAQEVQEWHRKVERLEATQKRKTKEAKNREFFEKVFPELRKQREDKERFNRVGARIKSEADLEEIMDGLQEQEMEDKKMRSYAVIPPLLLDKKQRKIAFQNRNGLLQPEELEAVHSERKLINIWIKTEHEVFKEKYLQHPKNFGAIAQSFDHKSVSDCVHHYYLTKKAENYKQLLRKSRRTRSTRNNPNNKVNNSNSAIGPMDCLTTGVTTRLQREQQQKTQENPQTSSSASASSSNSSNSVVSTTTSAPSTTSSTASSTTTTSVTSTASSLTTAVVAASCSNSNSTSVSPESMAASSATTTITTSTAVTASASVPTTGATTTTITTTITSSAPTVLTTTSSSSVSAKDAREANKENKDIKIEPKDTLLLKDIKEESQSSSETLSGREIKIEGKSALSSSSSVANANNTPCNLQHEQKDKKKNAGIGGSTSTSRSKDKKKENHAAPMETSDEETQGMDPTECGGRQLGPHPCAVCQTTIEAGSQSRPLPRSHASYYGLREEQVPTGARVCNSCRCKSVRGRYTTCPLPGCPNLNSASSGKTRVKRLRALPPKWNELPAEIRDPIILEFQIPSNVTKCCSACFNRISRRLAPHFSGSGDAADDVDVALGRQWTDEELELMRKALREHGTNWPKVSEQIAGKTNHQCKTYYLTYRKKLGLDQVVAEYYQSLGEERRPCLTDEEESGSSTSSCDELAVHDSSDTASAGSPANTIPSSTPTSILAASSSSSSTSSAVQSSGGAALTMGFPQAQETKVGEKAQQQQQQLADVAVVSLIAPSPMSSSQTPQTNPPTSTREDYDSSATETADEGQSGTDLDNTGVVVTFTPPTASNASSSTASSHPSSQSIVQTHPQPVLVHSPPSTTSGPNPLTVKDLMLGVIEMQLKRTPSDSGPASSIPVSSGTPTISSILKIDHRNDIGYLRDYKSASQVPNISNTAMASRESSLATLSVVSGSHAHRSAPSPQQISQMQATITPCPPPTPSQQPQPSSQDMLPKEGLVVMQAQQAMRETEGTLDLSIKKPRQQQEYNHTLQPPPSSHKPAPMSHYRPEPTPPSSHYYPHPHPPQEPQGRGAKSPHVYVSSPRPQAPLTPKLTNKVAAVVSTHPKLSPKLTNMSTPHKTGSITHGTPVSSARYDGLLRQMTPPGNTNQPNPSPTTVGSKEGGSITQGTPVHPFAVDKRSPMYDYHRSIRHSPVTTSNVPVQAQNSGVVVSHGQSSQYNSYPPRQTSNYTVEQLSSRQIIMNDYITSQQMQHRNRIGNLPESGNKSESPATLYCANTPPPQPHQQPRQGVIQRHNTTKHYAPPPPGLEAFSSLVDVAVQQPSLPVPHQPASSSGHEQLYMSMDRIYPDRHIDSRPLQNMPRLAHSQYQMAVAMQQREEQRERDMLIREKQEEEQQQRLQREKEQQQQQQLHHQQQMERMQREKELQQQQEHRLAQQREQELHQAAVAQAAADHRAAVQQREKEIQQQQQEHRLNMHQQQQQREKDMQQQHYRLVQQHQHQREKEMQMVAAAAQREKEHQEHRLAVQQREKEMQQQQEMRLAQQKRDKELQQQADHRLAMQQQRDNMVYLQQQQQRYQKQQMQHMQQHQQRIEAEQRRHIVQLYKDQHDHMYRELAESRQCESPNMPKAGGFYQHPRHPSQSQAPPPSARHSQSTSNQSSDSSTLTAANLIDAIITHQINQTADTSSDKNPSNNQSRPGDRLFRNFHRDSPSEPNGMAHSPAGEENANSSSGSGNASNSVNKGLTLGEHVDHIVNKDYGPMSSSYRPYPGYQMPEDWKRRKGGEADSVKPGDERQIIRVAQQNPPSSQTQPTHQSQQQLQPQFQHEPVSPPEPTTNHYPRRFYEPSAATTTTPVTPSSKSHLSPLDYVKNKIVEVMRTEDDKSSSGGGDRNGGSANDKDDKSCADSSPSGEMVIDESPREQQPPQPPVPTPTTFYPYNALGVHTGPPPAPPPTNTAAVTVVKTEEPAPLLSAQYEPLSDED
ncbi:histone-lysine N-methyltransferase 2D isoform X2 [Copidosoma floridanum]|uniref:histone-lysine N-methyltransferase 2D isoform X2 n=1 Tax=Copidosoma floridanum TaxID=29053 RepID=UPI000C6FA537|nr:histone-lysine N-methyltransferase 2D isoform X2 [Copidosoma floridanum]